MSTTLQQIESDIRQLPLIDQLRLMEHLAADIRRPTGTRPTDRDAQLAAMARDPEVQRELRLIELEV